MKSEVEQYPKAMHGPDGAEATVNSEEEEAALGKGWIDGHEYWAAKAEESDDEAEIEGTEPKKRGRKKKDAE